MKWRRAAVLIWILLNICSAVSAQYKDRTDSLVNVLKNVQSDTAKVSVLNRLCEAGIQKRDFEASFRYGQQALDLSRKIDFPEGEVNALYYITQNLTAQLRMEEAFKYAYECIDLSGKKRNFLVQGRTYRLLWGIYHHQGEYEKSLGVIQKAIKLFEQLNSESDLANGYSSLALTHQVRGMLSEALEYNHLALKLAEKVNDKHFVAIILNNIGDIYEQTKNYDKAIEYYRRAYAKNRANNDRTGVAYCLGGLASCYIKMKKYEEARSTLRTFLEQVLVIGDKVLINHAYTLLSELNMNTKNYPQAEVYARKALVINRESGFNEGIVNNLIVLAKIDFYKAQFDSARVHAVNCFQLGKKLRLITQVTEAALIAARCDSALRNYKSAYEYFALHKRYSDTLFNTDKSQEIERIEAKVAYEKEKELRLNREQLEEARRTNQYYIISGAFLLVLAGAGLLYYRFRVKVKHNHVLTLQKNKIALQNDYLEKAYDELNTTLERIQIQKNEIEHKNQKIEDSIRYAYRIQTAILPDAGYLNLVMPTHFIFYEPKDIVSGDFYWIADRDGLLFVCVADCTGHGVPGAFMSVAGSGALNHCINVLGLDRPDVILSELDRHLKSLLHQQENTDSSDGMDAALLIIDFQRKKAFFAGAKRPLWFLRDGKPEEIKGDKFSIGGSDRISKLFHCEEINIKKGDRFYLFTDGITDQFGGGDKKKFTPKRLQQFILTHQSVSLPAQGELFRQTMTEWMVNHKQLDDLTLIGLEI